MEHLELFCINDLLRRYNTSEINVDGIRGLKFLGLMIDEKSDISGTNSCCSVWYFSE